MPENQNNSNEPEFQSFLKSIFNTKKWLIIAFIAICVVIVLLIISIILNKSGKSKPYENLFSGEIKELRQEISALKKHRKDIEDSSTAILSRIEKLYQDRDALSIKLSDQIKQLADTKKAYEKINSYNNLPVDSLRRLLSEKFGK